MFFRFPLPPEVALSDRTLPFSLVCTKVESARVNDRRGVYRLHHAPRGEPLLSSKGAVVFRLAPVARELARRVGRRPSVDVLRCPLSHAARGGAGPRPVPCTTRAKTLSPAELCATVRWGKGARISGTWYFSFLWGGRVLCEIPLVGRYGGQEYIQVSPPKTTCRTADSNNTCNAISELSYRCIS